MQIQREKLGPVKLKPSEGDSLRKLIFDNFKGSQGQYAELVGMKSSNISFYLNGDKPMEHDTLQRLLSGIGYTVKCQVTIHLLPKQTGQDASIANFVKLEEQSLYDDQDW